MRRSILDIASVKENITPVQISIVLSPAPTGLQPLGGELPRLNPGLSFQGPSGRNRLQIRHTHLGLSSLTPLGFIPAALLITDLFLESNQITEY
jgi:hypothetical protein